MKTDVKSERSYIDELLLLRPKGDDSSSIEVAITAIKGKVVEYDRHISELCGRRIEALECLPAVQILAIDEEISLLKISIEKAEVLTGQLETKLKAVQLDEKTRAYNEAVQKLQADNGEFHQEFMPEYERMVFRFWDFMERYKKLCERGRALYGDIGLLNSPPISEVYFSKTVLPFYKLHKKHRFGTPYAHKADFWRFEPNEPSRLIGNYDPVFEGPGAEELKKSFSIK